ncbi:MAG: hypothetical protein K6T83_11700, partial [Alicyclobacillus sp.]|nr:hypothetical protein [Alicyclobacillus sp.]
VHVKIENMTAQHQHLVDAAGSEDASDSRMNVTPTVSKALAVVAVAAGDGLKEAFTSLGAEVLDGGQTMNPSTEQIVAAVEATQAERVIFLPNNKNIVLAAEQAKAILGERLMVLDALTIPHGIVAVAAYLPSLDAETNRQRMSEAMTQVVAGQVVQAVRDSVYQEQTIRQGQYLGLVNQDLVAVGETRLDVAVRVVKHMGADTGELLTIFAGQDVPESELNQLRQRLTTEFPLDVEVHCGGQPIYHYIFAME